eukprot:CAMPEP_0117067242 /NCGR_PEP_ID=MMETSP0472-20121206/47042_1 /TAXON_ID=693140 ORGANISM="Tiarina fusus, Strain LIS" /NCGR_SAMPLE_ID=MMETSP0472 /ASSEMBLY_ACC=CAM_ASM_000603 /LENGTH=89 /DNA_ID=CAMNT_0004788655 /DNA_START=89 /DNA_END=358 /DNA_ORIENTATION=+
MASRSFPEKASTVSLLGSGVTRVFFTIACTIATMSPVPAATPKTVKVPVISSILRRADDAAAEAGQRLGAAHLDISEAILPELLYLANQ